MELYQVIEKLFQAHQTKHQFIEQLVSERKEIDDQLVRMRSSLMDQNCYNPPSNEDLLLNDNFKSIAKKLIDRYNDIDNLLLKML